MLKALALLPVMLFACGGSDSGGAQAGATGFPVSSGTFNFQLANPSGIGTMCADPAARLIIAADRSIAGQVNLGSCTWTDTAGVSHTATLAGNVTGGGPDFNTLSMTIAQGGASVPAFTIAAWGEAFGLMGLASAPKGSPFASASQVKLFAFKQ